MAAINYVGLLETEGLFEDNEDPLAFEVVIPARKLDLPANAILRRIFIEADTRSQLLTPTLYFVDGTSTVYPDFSTTGRQTVEYSVAVTSRWLAVGVAGLITQSVEIFGLELEVWVPSVIAEPFQTMQEVGR